MTAEEAETAANAAQTAVDRAIAAERAATVTLLRDLAGKYDGDLGRNAGGTLRIAASLIEIRGLLDGVK